MLSRESLSRRSFFALAAAVPLASAAAKGKKIPVGLELYSVREEMKKDLFGTVKGVAKMGYEVVEFYSPYLTWTPAYAKDVRKLLDDSGLRCLSTHNDAKAILPENLAKTVELNQIIGSKIAVVASAGKMEKIDDWKKFADRLNKAAEALKPQGMRTGFHNHQTEFKAIEGGRPIEVLAANTTKNVVLQLDIGTCIEAGSDPVAWIKKNPGRFATIHCKDWSRESGVGYQSLFGEGAAPWKKIFEAAEKKGGIEYYLIEQEGSRYPAMETAERCLANFKKMRA
jgi:sugar phosphate isomerase/epimerase